MAERQRNNLFSINDEEQEAKSNEEVQESIHWIQAFLAQKQEERTKSVKGKDKELISDSDAEMVKVGEDAVENIQEIETADANKEEFRLVENVNEITNVETEIVTDNEVVKIHRDTVQQNDQNKDEIEIVQTEDIETFFSQNMKYLRQIKQSKYAIYPKDETDYYQNCMNILATAEKHVKKSKNNPTIMNVQDLNQKYKAWKAGGYNQNQIIPVMEKAAENAQADIKRTMLNPAEPKKKQISIMSAFKMLKNRNKPSQKRKEESSESTSSTPSTSTRTEVQLQPQTSVTIFDDVCFKHYSPKPEVADEISSRLNVINDFRVESAKFIKNRKFIINKTSDIGKEINNFDRKLLSVKNLMNDAENIEIETIKNSVGLGAVGRHRITSIAVTKIEALESEIPQRLLAIDSKEMKKVIADLRKRNITKDGQMAKKQKNKTQTPQKSSNVMKQKMLVKHGKNVWRK